MKTATSLFETFKKYPLRFGAGLFLIALSIFIFFGKVDFKVKHGDTEAHISTQTKK